jgi:hypothetical protein
MLPILFLGGPNRSVFQFCQLRQRNPVALCNFCPASTTFETRRRFAVPKGDLIPTQEIFGWRVVRVAEFG